MPFVNGDDPTLEPHNLPDLTSHDAIMDFTDQQSADFRGHYPCDALPNDVKERKKLICIAIGCKLETLDVSDTEPKLVSCIVPGLASHDVVKNLTDEQSMVYFSGYYPGVSVPDDDVERKRRICIAIEC
ncbi:hypothetical protein AX16_010941 [Volvariella volvacea WC 439]|nr:hypothetical protein AX16_010941 [Volvariella volvacea WC 439]